jgi:hypothetical protein
MSNERERLDVIAREHARVAAQTVPEREEEHWAIACRSARVRGWPLPDRDTHRRAFYERAGYVPAPAPIETGKPSEPEATGS